MRLRIVIRSGLLAVLAAASQPGYACGGMSGVTGDGSAHPGVKLQIYRLQLKDQYVVLSRVPLDGGSPVKLAKHRIGGENEPYAEALEILALSPDRRQALFGFDPGEGPTQQVLLFQAKGERERKLLSFPRGTLLYAGFSPDGSQLALYAKDSDVPNAPHMGLYLFDTASGKSRYLAAPVEAKDTTYGFAPRWSGDGQWLFLTGPGEYRVDVENGRFEPARRLPAEQVARCGTGDSVDIEFQGRRIATTAAVKPQSELGCGSMASPAGAVASFDKDAWLWVESGGERRRVLQAPHSVERFDENGVSMGPVPCGHTYGILGWMDDRFMVYQLDDSSYVYDMERRTTFQIPGDQEEDRFWW